MLHAEMVIVVPVIAFTFLVMGWIIKVFRGFLRQRDAIVSAWQDTPEALQHDTGAQPAAGHAKAA